MTKQKSTSSTNDKSVSNADDNQTPLDDIDVIQALEQELSEQKQSKPTSSKIEQRKANANDKSANTKTATKPSTDAAKQSSGISKTALLALLLAIAAGAGVAGSYWYSQQQLNAKLSELVNDNQAQQQTFQQQIERTLQSSGRTNEQRLAQVINNSTKATTETIELLENKLARMENQLSALANKNPSDWVLNEVEFLVRAANRSLLLDKDLATVTSLLIDADKRIESLNDPQYLPIRVSIRTDIEQLAMLPVLATDSVILSLMALNKSIDNLPLAMVEIPEPSNTDIDTELSTDIADWQQNLQKTWHRFLSDFITVRRRTGAVEPLMTPEQQINLRQNLSLKLQQAQWAATQNNAQIYQQTLADVSLWLSSYFDLTSSAGQQFSARIDELKSATVAVEYPSALQSLKQVRLSLNQRDQHSLTPMLENNSPKEKTDSVLNNNDSEQPKEPEEQL